MPKWFVTCKLRFFGRSIRARGCLWTVWTQFQGFQSFLDQFWPFHTTFWIHNDRLSHIFNVFDHFGSIFDRYFDAFWTIFRKISATSWAFLYLPTPSQSTWFINTCWRTALTGKAWFASRNCHIFLQEIPSWPGPWKTFYARDILKGAKEGNSNGKWPQKSHLRSRCS